MGVNADAAAVVSSVGEFKMREHTCDLVSLTSGSPGLLE